MDLLLRRLGRQTDTAAVGAKDHLDADELNAYAENVLPAAARMRYTAHLADCASCRNLILQLSSAAGVVAEKETPKEVTPSALRRFLSSLFSPMVVRYAAPVLGLIVVAMIGLVVLRRDRADKAARHVSQLREQVATPAEKPAPGSGGLMYDSIETKSNEQQVRGNVENKKSQPVPNAPPVVSVTAEVQEDKSLAKPVPQPTSNAAVAPAPPKVAADAPESRGDIDAVGRAKEETVTVKPGAVTKKTDEFKEVEDRKVAATQTMGAREPGKLAARDAGSVQGARPAAKAESKDQLATEKEKDDNAETRTVAGRSFRRLRGVWTDTAYDAAGSTLTVSRGSERYRSLIADEPELKTIAEQLGGEIIVVWKGRTYRIR